MESDELLELILYKKVANLKNREIAKKLIEQFKSLGRVISDFYDLKSIAGIILYVMLSSYISLSKRCGILSFYAAANM